MSAYQQDLNGNSIESAHLTREPPTGSPSQLDANPERNEWHCKDCGRRVTVSYEDTEGITAEIESEYGHDVSCEYSCAVEGTVHD